MMPSFWKRVMTSELTRSRERHLFSAAAQWSMLLFMYFYEVTCRRSFLLAVIQWEACSYCMWLEISDDWLFKSVRLALEHHVIEGESQPVVHQGPVQAPLSLDTSHVQKIPKSVPSDWLSCGRCVVATCFQHHIVSLLSIDRVDAQILQLFAAFFFLFLLECFSFSNCAKRFQVSFGCALNFQFSLNLLREVSTVQWHTVHLQCCNIKYVRLHHFALNNTVQ